MKKLEIPKNNFIFISSGKNLQIRLSQGYVLFIIINKHKLFVKRTNIINLIVKKNFQNVLGTYLGTYKMFRDILKYKYVMA